MFELDQQKASFRKLAQQNRAAQPNKDEVSQQILARIFSLPEYASARVLLFYVDARHEVRTRSALPAALASHKQIVVPYCLHGQLELFHLEHLDELEPGAFQILEPKVELRHVTNKRAAIQDVDLLLIPGVAFDRRGARLGHGLGYYDKLLRGARPDALVVGLAYDCQVFDQLPTADHDIFMDYVVTESGIYRGG